MSDSGNSDNTKGLLSLRSAGRLELGRTVDAGSVRQSFSHGRSKVVQVEVRKKRVNPDAQRLLEEEARRAAEEEARRIAEEEARRQEEERERIARQRARARALPQISRLSGVTQEPVGARWVPKEESFEIDPAGDANDAEIATTPFMQQLHSAALRQAKEFLPLANRMDNAFGWGGAAEAARSFLDNIDCSSDNLHLRLGNIYEAILSLGSFLELDNRLLQDPNASMDPLAPEIRRSLSQLIRTAAPWLRQLPTIQRLDDATGAFLTKKELLDPATAMTEAARAMHLISEVDAQRLIFLLATEKRGGFQGQKAQNRVVATARNLLMASAGFVALFYVNSLASDFATKSLFVGKVGTFLSRVMQPIELLVEDLPGDIKLAITMLLDQLKVDPPGAPLPFLPTEGPSLRRRPETDFNAEATRLILAGTLPPESWWPLITHLDLSRQKNFNRINLISNLINLQTLNLQSTRVSNIVPLTDLVGLQSVNLRGTRVEDIRPLSGLVGLRFLDLVGTLVKDLSPLSNLFNLETLDIRSTRVTNVAPLSKLTHLKDLDVRGTGIKTVSSLSGLKGLRVRTR